MAIPDYQTIMLPLLQFMRDKQEHSVREDIDHISELFKLSDEEKKQRTPSGQQVLINNRVGWARTYLKKAGLLESTKRGYVRITDRGLEVLGEKPSKINVKYLKRFPEFIKFQTVKKEKKIYATKKKDNPQFSPRSHCHPGWFRGLGYDTTRPNV
jgi:restriction system protein